MEARKQKSSRLLAWLIAIAVMFTMTPPSSFVWAAEDQTPTEAPAVEESSNKEPGGGTVQTCQVMQLPAINLNN